MATERVLRLALIGRREFLHRYRSIVPRVRGVRLAALIELNAGENAGHAPPAAGEFQATGVDELLSRHADQFDAVVCDRAGARNEEGLVRMAKAGKHILGFDSLELARGQIARVSRACRESGVCFLPGLRGRFSPSVRTIQESIDAGRLGAPGLLRIHKWKPRVVDTDSSAVIPAQATGELTFAPLIDEIDLACRVFGRFPVLVYAKGTSAASGDRANRDSIGDYLQLHLAFSEGGMALIDLAVSLPEGDPYFSVSVIGSTGAAYADDHHNRQLLFGGGTPDALLRDMFEVEAAGQLREFCAAIAAGRAPSPAADDYVRILHVVDAAAQSLSTGSPVPPKGAG